VRPLRPIRHLPSTLGINAAGITWLSPLFKLGIVLGLTLLGQPRIISRHGA
jgi:hypothetical protein